MDDDMSIPEKIGATASKHPLTAASIALAVVSILGPGRTIRFALKGIAVASLASKLAGASKKASAGKTDHDADRPAPLEAN